MLVSKIMQVLSNLFGLNKKINANDIAVKDNNGKARTLDKSVIVNSGNNENGNWVKWADGTMIVRQSKICDQVTTSVTDGNIYRSNLGTMPDFPVEFSEPPDVFLTLTNAFKLIVAGQEGTTTKKRAFEYEGNPALIGVESATFQTRTNVKVNLLAIGRWK